MAFAMASKNDTFTSNMRTSYLKWLLVEHFGAWADKSIFAPQNGIGEVLSGVLDRAQINLNLALLDVEHCFYWISAVQAAREQCLVFYCATFRPVKGQVCILNEI